MEQQHISKVWQFRICTWTLLLLILGNWNWRQRIWKTSFEILMDADSTPFLPSARRRQAQLSLLVAPSGTPTIYINRLVESILYTSSKYSSMFQWMRWLQSCQQCPCKNTFRWWAWTQFSTATLAGMSGFTNAWSWTRVLNTVKLSRHL